MFLGPPGTGKTTVAHLYGQILVRLGLLSNGEVIAKGPSDFIGDVIGAFEKNTKDILENAKGKVLIIDKAYTFGGGSQYDGPDSFRSAVLDTLVDQIKGDVHEDHCVILAGYEKQMEDMVRDGNPGLKRRFPNNFKLKEFSKDDLKQIWQTMLRDHDM